MDVHVGNIKQQTSPIGGTTSHGKWTQNFEDRRKSCAMFAGSKCKRMLDHRQNHDAISRDMPKRASYTRITRHKLTEFRDYCSNCQDLRKGNGNQMFSFSTLLDF